jgi:ribosomal protein L40E
MKNVISNLTREELQHLFDINSSISSILRSLNRDISTGGGYRTLMGRVEKENIDLVLFKKNREDSRQKNRESICKRAKRPNEEVFCENSNYSRTGLKKRLLKDFGWPNICGECGISDFYNGKPISLQLDHTNGINNDNRFGNLRFLCPNCHSQTENYSGKSNRKNEGTLFCKCGAEKGRFATNCRKCHSKLFAKAERKQKIAWPAPEEMKKILWRKPTTQISKEMGVSDTAISKFCKKHAIIKPSRGYWLKRENKMD